MLTPEGKLQSFDTLPQVYLGGGLDSEWRDEFTNRFCRKHPSLIEYDPFRQSRQGSIAEFTVDDLAGLEKCSLLIARVDYHRYSGLALEVGFAKARGIPVMLIWTLESRIDPMMAGCALWVFTDTTEAFDFIEKRLI